MTKTSVVLVDKNGGVVRGVIPEDMTPEEVGMGRSKRGFPVARFVAAANHKYQDGGTFNIATGKLDIRLGKTKVEHVPDSIKFDSRSFEATGLKGEARRWPDGTRLLHIDPSHIDQIDALDNQIAELQARRTELVKAAAAAGKPLSRWACLQPKPKEA